jgi:hypothetical protein
MSSLLAERPGSPLIGEQRPRICSLPSSAVSWSAGEDTAELARNAGLILDDWQRYGLVHSMAETAAALWAAFEVAFVLSRQNGKNGIVEARQLGGLFLLHEKLMIHTAHRFNASEEHFRRMRDTIDANDWMRRRVKRLSSAPGKESIELRPTPTLVMGSDGAFVRKSVASRLAFLARAGGAGRAFSARTVFWDEGMILTDDQVGAQMPTLAAVWNPQLWYTASAGNKLSLPLGRVRRRALAGNDPSLMYMEWSVDPHTRACNLDPELGPVCILHDDPHAPASWARANPGMGIRITEDYIRKEMASMSPSGVRTDPPDVFATERLGVGDWPAEDDAWSVIGRAVWEARADADAPRPRPRVAIAADASPGQVSASIGVAGALQDGRTLVEIPDGDHRDGVGWVVPRLVELKKANRPCAIVIDPRGPLSGVIDEAEKAGLEITKPALGDSAQAFAQFRAGVAEGKPPLVHLGQRELDAALAGATVRDTGDGGQLWARRDTSVDISPLVAVTLASWALGRFGRAYNLLASVAPPT